MSASPRLDLRGRLRLSAPRSGMELRAEGPELCLRVDRARGLLDLWKLRRAPRLGGAPELLARSDVRLHVDLAGRRIARVGAGVRPGRFLAPLLGLGGRVEVRALALSMALFSRFAARFSS